MYSTKTEQQTKQKKDTNQSRSTFLILEMTALKNELPRNEQCSHTKQRRCASSSARTRRRNRSLLKSLSAVEAVVVVVAVVVGATAAVDGAEVDAAALTAAAADVDERFTNLSVCWS
jgi:hypothetical protein